MRAQRSRINYLKVQDQAGNAKFELERLTNYNNGYSNRDLAITLFITAFPWLVHVLVDPKVSFAYAIPVPKFSPITASWSFIRQNTAM